ncbi:MAG: hypothetical protein CM1200mP39_24620 [Dehalococcoidia bacterium]|nr:MAG: hypothetical protein CM1200mP39_24620 [Dehalococcoidia bacterium]
MDFDQEIGEIQRKAVQSQEGIGRRKIIMDSLAVASGQSILWTWDVVVDTKFVVSHLR